MTIVRMITLLSDMAQKEFEFILNEQDMGYMCGEEYQEKASFGIVLMKHVEAGPLSGFTAEVNCSLRDEKR